MGANLCVMCHLTSDQNSKSPNLKKEKFCNILERKIETAEKKVAKATLEDCILASPRLKPDYHYVSRKKVHPCVTQFRGSLIAEAKDSLCLDRPINMTHHHKQAEEMLCDKSLSQKRVTFKLPHILIFYSPDHPFSPEEQEQDPYYSSESEASFYSSICRENSFDSSAAEEPIFRLAVDILPHVTVSSRI
ncbi:hypothetical protein CR513_49346, partial [Mucuna pruriens]